MGHRSFPFVDELAIMKRVSEQWNLFQTTNNSTFSDLGDGELFFTTGLLRNGTLILRERHLERVEKSSKYFSIDASGPLRFIDTCCQNMNNHKQLMVRFAVVVEQGKLLYRSWTRDLPAQEVGLKLGSYCPKRWRGPYPQFLKIWHYDEVFQWRADKNVDDVLILDKNSLIVEAATSALILLHKRGDIIIPRGQQALESISLAHIKDYWRHKGQAWKECPVEIKDLQSFDSAWLVNAARGVRKVEKIDRVSFPWTLSELDFPRDLNP